MCPLCSFAGFAYEYGSLIPFGEGVGNICKPGCGITLIAVNQIIVTIGPVLQCSQQADARLLFISCVLQGGTLDFATCSFDNGPATRCKCGGDICMLACSPPQYSFSFNSQ